MHDIYVCFPHSFRIDKRQRKTFPPAILVSKKRPWNCAKTRRVFLRENDIGPLTRFFFGFEKSTVVEAIPFRAQRGASNRWTALFIRSILCRRRTKATWRSWRCEKKPSKTTFQPLWSALQHGFCTGLVTESPRKCAFNSCLGTIYSEFAQKSHPFFLRGGAGWGCGTLLAKCFVYFWPGFLTAWARDAQSQCQSDWSGSASIRPSAVHFRTRMDPWCWRSWALLFVRWDGWDMPKNA